ncbi:MarR family transcriptional regulator [[Bacillus] enclensis]|uniref:DNA-binding transcriptional regulator, MarR family n=1 Tax=[Bacillus] enclensis TaxID=1402860 RepID=A0A0V8HQ96_9BACI|nr:MarR family winged helix-turn-helix transcriptional regulator [[Bacillus] enclensis]KSU64708.1 MarR family transcriptional regulator [[Bacillus] enclensis]SCB74869.1 DNA-binding transcriptional regulator, MarR family [[Bacillus] enclensis]
MKDQSIFELLHTMDQVTNKLLIQWNKSFKESLGISHILVLSHLQVNGKSRPSDIAKNLGITPPSLTNLANKLVSKDLIVRLFDEKDRRNSYLEITDAGIEMVNKAADEGQNLRRNLFEKLSKDERRQLTSIYEKLNHFL